MRVVLDTVVLVRGLIAPYSWWGRVIFERTNDYRWVVSPPIVVEYLDVLGRPELARRFRTVAGRDLRVVMAQLDKALVIEPTETPAICRDPNDDMFLAAAKAGRAQFIITADADLLDLGRYEETAIVSAEEFLRSLDVHGDQDDRQGAL